MKNKLKKMKQFLHLFTFILMMTEAFSQNISKLFSQLKLVTDNLFIYAEANWEPTEKKLVSFPGLSQLQFW